jgi:arylsulfatase A-like enzyme
MVRRNTILFQAESWNGRMLGALGHPALQDATPNIDRIAASGTFFERAVCSHPICCPLRANMWSLLDEPPHTDTFQSCGKLGYLSGEHTQLASLSAWLGPSGVELPVFDAARSQCFAMADDDDPRYHEQDWSKDEPSQHPFCL